MRKYLLAELNFIGRSLRHKSVPRSLLEAMALGKPIITIDSVGCREVGYNGCNVYLIPIRDAHTQAI